MLMTKAEDLDKYAFVKDIIITIALSLYIL